MQRLFRHFNFTHHLLLSLRITTDDYISTLNISVPGALSFGEKKGLNCGYPTLTALFFRNRVLGMDKTQKIEIRQSSENSVQL